MTRSSTTACALLATALLAGCGASGSSFAEPPDAPAAPSSTVGSMAPAPTSSAPEASETPAQASSGRPSPATVGDVRVAGTIAGGLRSPWGLALLPGGGALVSERDTGKIRYLNGRGQGEVLGTVPGVRHGGEGGLLGLAVSPDFAADRTVFAYLTSSSDNRVVRMRWPDGGDLGEPEPVFTGIPRGGIHNGGRLLFDADGMLLVSTGDSGERSQSQDKNALGGKILRITPDGEPAPGNPFDGSPVWSYGHRNVQGLAFDEQGRLWASEFGQNTWDELNLIEPGSNYGWPEVEGRAGQEGFVDPVAQWRTSEASPSGIAVARGSVWMAALRGQRLWRVPLTGDPVGEPQAYFAGELGRLRTVVEAPDGSLWLVTSTTDGRGDPRDGGDRVLRITLD